MTAETAQRTHTKPQPKPTFEAVKRAAHNRGPEIITALGLSAELLQPRNHTCPVCGKPACFRFKAPDAGGALCHKCQPTGIGDWFSLANWIRGPMSPKEQLDFVATAIGFERGPQSDIAPPARPSATLPAHEPFEKTFRPLGVQVKSFFVALTKAKRPFTVEGLLAAGAERGKAQFHPKCPVAEVVGVPVYSPTTLEQIDWCFYGANGQPLPAGKGQFAKTRFLHGNDGVFVSLRGLELLRAKRPAGGLRIVKVEGLSDFIALLSCLDEAAENLLIFSQAAGACALSTALPMSNCLSLLEPTEMRCIGDADLAGQAGLVGGKMKNGEIAAGFGYGNILAAAIPGPTFNVRLFSEITESHGKDLRDFLNSGHEASEILTWSADRILPCNVEEFEKRSRKSGKPAGGGGVTRDDLTNFVLDDDERKLPVPLFEILSTIKERFDGFPKRVGSSLFVLENERLFYLDRVSALFSWMRERATVTWGQGPSLLTRDELFDALRRHADDFDDVQTLPHFPEPISGIFYTCRKPEPTDGSQLDKLLDFFSPATPEDRQLIKAAIVTLFWNGGPGQRAGFIFSGTGGQGTGKTTAVHAITKLVGGVIDFGQRAESDAIKTRLLSPGAAGKRAILIDNIKASKFSSGDFESLVTAPQISGKRMYEGEASRPNYYTAFLTMNSPSFSRDIAQRFINVVLDKPTYAGDWQRSIDRFIAEQRETLISDIAGFFQRTPLKLSRLNRWGAWQTEILARLDDAEKVAALITAREEVNDADRELAEEIQETFRSKLKELGFSPDSPFAVHIPVSIAADWISEALGEPCTGKSATMLLSRLSESGLLFCLTRNPSRTCGRGFVWRSASGEGAPIDYELSDKIAAKSVREKFYGRSKSASEEIF